MLTITDIVPQKKEGRVNIYIDGEFFCGLSEKIVVKYNLKIDLKLEKKKLLAILKEDQFEKAKNVAFRFLSFRLRTKKEVEKKLLEKGFHPQIIEQTIEYLLKNGFLDDQQFIEAWLKDREKIKPSGILKIQKELKEKGIEPFLIEKTINQLRKDEKVLARQALEKKLARFEKLPVGEKKKKIKNFLYSRGFSPQTIWEILKEIK